MGSASWIHGRIDEGQWRGLGCIPYVASHSQTGTTLRWRNQVSITPQLYWTGNVTNGLRRARPTRCCPRAPARGAMTAPSRCSTPGYALVDLHLGWHQLLDGRAAVAGCVQPAGQAPLRRGGLGLRTFWDMPQQPAPGC